MALVANATGVYATLGYNFNDPNGTVQQFSKQTQEVMNEFPPVIQPWQAQDIASNSVGNYFQNPVAVAVNNIITVSGEIFNLSNLISGNAESSYSGTANLDPLISSSNALNITASSFLIHTNKVSGVIPPAGQTDTNVNPYYQTAVGYGKQAIYITNQTDGVVNNSPIMGCMTSILVGPQINANSNTLSADYITLTNGISGNTLSNAQVTQITTHMTTINSFLSTRQSSDVAFFGRLQSLVNNYNTTKQFTNMGETETNLVNNLIGTPSLVAKINS